MHKYEIIATGRYDKHFKFRPSDFEQVIKLISFTLEFKKQDGDITFFLSGKKATAEALLNAAQADKDAHWKKKNQTHKKIRVKTGVSGFVKKTVWLRK